MNFHTWQTLLRGRWTKKREMTKARITKVDTLEAFCRRTRPRILLQEASQTGSYASTTLVWSDARGIHGSENILDGLNNM